MLSKSVLVKVRNVLKNNINYTIFLCLEGMMASSGCDFCNMLIRKVCSHLDFCKKGHVKKSHKY